MITVHTGAETIQGRKPFKGGNYLRKYGIWTLAIIASDTPLGNFSWSNVYFCQAKRQFSVKLYFLDNLWAFSGQKSEFWIVVTLITNSSNKLWKLDLFSIVSVNQIVLQSLQKLGIILTTQKNALIKNHLHNSVRKSDLCHLIYLVKKETN